jgi:hypothetical protein
LSLESHGDDDAGWEKLLTYSPELSGSPTSRDIWEWDEGMRILIINIWDMSTDLYHHHMALQPNTGPGLPFWGFITITFLQGWIVSPAPNPQPGGPGLLIYDPQRQGGPAVPPGTGYPF